VVVVFDASIIFPLLVNEEKSLVAREIYAESQDVIFLDFLRLEIAIGLASSVRRRRFDQIYAKEAMEKLDKLILGATNSAPFVTAAFALALEINHPVYDCLYAIAARKNDATLVTCDTKFAAKLDPEIYSVRVI
jgi:predicted nucleic acid-binding protein